MTTRNVIKFAAIFMLCLMGGLAVTLYRIAGPDGLDLVNPKVLLHSGGRGIYFRHQQWLADAQTLVWAVRYWFEPERTVAPVALPVQHTNAIVAALGGVSATGGIISTSTPAEFDPVTIPATGAVGPTFDGAAGRDKLGPMSGGVFSATPNG